MDMKEVLAFEKPAVEVKPSEWIRRGIPLVIDERTVFLRDGCGCALGGGYHAKTGCASQPSGIEAFALIAETLGLPRLIAQKINDNHFDRVWTREECADYAESMGF